MCIDNCMSNSTLCVLTICVFIAHCHLYKYELSICKPSEARSQAFHSPRHMCCSDVTIKMI